MLHALEGEILQTLADGYTTFLCGGALGVDTWAAEIVLRLWKNLSLTLCGGRAAEGRSGGAGPVYDRPQQPDCCL